jgi:2-amino-4-hydroxy-6-hydroxymethyldihydropteridine diphosphokinase
MAGRPVRAYVALGSNLGDRAGFLVRARRALESARATRVVAASRIWETEPVGPPGQGPYLNAVLAVETRLPARALLDELLGIEREAGRDRTAEPRRWGPRVLDLDLLLYGDTRMREPGLEIPHPRLHERAFVLEPLCEIAPDLVHPVLGERMAALLAHCGGRDEVRPWDGRAEWSAEVAPGDPTG